jgi:hypothetical protein
LYKIQKYIEIITVYTITVFSKAEMGNTFSRSGNRHIGGPCSRIEITNIMRTYSIVSNFVVNYLNSIISTEPPLRKQLY